jgi:hypothetical protein
MTGLTDMSNTSAVSGVTGITALPEYMKYGRIRLPKMNDLTFKGLSKVQAYGQGIYITNHYEYHCDELVPSDFSKPYFLGTQV